MKIWQNKTLWLFTLVGLAAFVLSTIAWGDNFLSDEYEFIYAANQIHNWPSFVQVITDKIGGDFWRPILYLSFILDFWLYGLKPLGYHLTNSLLQTINSLLVSLTIWQIAKLYWPRATEPKKLFVAIVSGLLFGIFPNHHETVTWLAGRTDLLATTWYLLALFLWLKYLPTFNQPASAGEKWFLFLATVISSALAYLTKEVSITLILILLITAIVYWRYYRLTKIQTIKLAADGMVLSIVFFVYLIIRRLLVGYWFGGYMITGSSAFLNLNLTTLKYWLLAPINILFYSFNYSYFRHLLAYQPKTFDLYLTYLPWLKIIILLVILLVIIGTIYLANRRRSWRSAIILISLGLGWIYLTIGPAFGMLTSLGRNLESTRLFYLPSIGICFLLALWLSLWPRFWRYLFTTGLTIILIAFYIFNYQPWSLASASAELIQQTLQNQTSQFQPADWIYILNAPDNLYGAYVFRRGLTQMAALTAPALQSQQVIMTGRGVSGTHAANCLLNQSTKFWLMTLDPITGLVQSFTLKNTPADQSQKWLTITDRQFDYSDLKKLNNNTYQVIGDLPTISLANLNLDPQTITSLRFNLVPVQDLAKKSIHLYWTTTSQPDYHEFLRHIWLITDISAQSESDQVISIPVCQYPAWVFGGLIQNLKITLPFRPGDTFILK
ncbi:MAG: hypothetical protein WC480_00815 [Patescibacteria group bacterium]